MNILVINCGSSSLKFQLIDAKSAEDADKLENNIAEIVNSIPEGESLPSVYLFLYKDLKEELDG